jgi:hypothetical protein
MAFQILLPRALYRRLESEHQQLAPAHFQRELIRGEGFAETHLGVPEKMRRPAGIFFFEALEIVCGLDHRRRLLRPHLEIQRAVFFVQLAAAHGDDRGFHLGHGAAKPFALGIFHAIDP